MTMWLLIAGMLLLTFLPRYIPIALAGKFKIPTVLNQALEFVSIAVLTAIIAKVSVIHDSKIDLQADNPYLYALIAAFIVAKLSRNIFVTIIVGLLTYAITFHLF